MATHLILLAAGEGSRMQSERAKVLHEIGGAPMFVHALRTMDSLDDGERILVVGHDGETVAKAAHKIDAGIQIVTQTERLGTAHAVKSAQSALDGLAGDALVLYGDTPFIKSDTLSKMAQARATGADIVVLGFKAADPGRYGRLVADGERLLRIVEWKDALPEERSITLCNSGVIMADSTLLLELVGAVQNDNAANEYYLTDIVEIGREKDLTAVVVTCDEAETLGINTRSDLAAAEAVFQSAKRAELLESGVTMVSPDTVHLSFDTQIGRDAHIEPFVVFEPGVTVETGARIRAFSHLEDCHIGQGAVVGPYARLRPGTELSNDVKIGNFVEIKNAEIGDGAKVNHLSYVGDARVGSGTNIGAGTVTCNYDGVSKHHTHIGENTFIGSNTLLVAPVSVGDRAMTATGTVVTRDVPPGDLAVARAKQENKPGFAVRLMDKLRAAKEKKLKG